MLRRLFGKKKIDKDKVTMRLHVTPHQMTKKPSDIEVLQDHGPMLAFDEGEHEHGNGYTLVGPSNSFKQWARNGKGYLMNWVRSSDDGQEWFFQKITPK